MVKGMEFSRHSTLAEHPRWGPWTSQGSAASLESGNNNRPDLRWLSVSGGLDKKYIRCIIEWKNMKPLKEG